MEHRLSARFWVELVSGTVSAALVAITVMVPEWIEVLSGAALDGGDGSAEWALALTWATVSGFCHGWRHGCGFGLRTALSVGCCPLWLAGWQCGAWDAGLGPSQNGRSARRAAIAVFAAASATSSSTNVAAGFSTGAACQATSLPSWCSAGCAIG